MMMLSSGTPLVVAPARLRQICDHVLGQLGSHSPECLPIVIKFRMQQGGGADGMDVNLLTANMIADSSTMHTASTNNGPITALDLLVLLLHHQNAHRRSAETTVIKLASTGRLTTAMAVAMFARHTRAFLMCFKSIVHMADILNRQQEAAYRHLASTAGGGSSTGSAHWHGAGTGDHPKLLHPFALMLNGILDCLSNLHFIHIWQLFRVLTTLTFDRQRIPAAGLIDHEKEDGV
ncbi:hypothetical protein PTSG_09679 [Salpingoeca rosetta]|uniref:Uncharacterized protein n=1 Tax=Salpingoeca rosetta (strain ATCC 50818 / BSB-021) TaxID=946362 RepID=F2ULP2_SALR5|nr:uncharacterized protein PTSG_09679 [Salpingoeca rosetta]EGD78041.1 hypothetical protein PTSG_09679 [Salpingoeca rosetta]|eukprot:XP_004990103.1 hypothetical protein PTSG_09679 [Salpingoeca rosetta]